MTIHHIPQYIRLSTTSPSFHQLWLRISSKYLREKFKRTLVPIFEHEMNLALWHSQHRLTVSSRYSADITSTVVAAGRKKICATVSFFFSPKKSLAPLAAGRVFFNDYCAIESSSTSTPKNSFSSCGYFSRKKEQAIGKNNTWISSKVKEKYVEGRNFILDSRVSIFWPSGSEEFFVDDGRGCKSSCRSCSCFTGRRVCRIRSDFLALGDGYVASKLWLVVLRSIDLLVQSKPFVVVLVQLLEIQYPVRNAIENVIQLLRNPELKVQFRIFNGWNWTDVNWNLFYPFKNRWSIFFKYAQCSISTLAQRRIQIRPQKLGTILMAEICKFADFYPSHTSSKWWC